jgi:hypothetical protein
MYIPKKLITERFYVALRPTKAVVSCKSLEDAMICIERYREHAPHEFTDIKGVIRVTDAGREWVDDKKLVELLRPL